MCNIGSYSLKTKHATDGSRSKLKVLEELTSTLNIRSCGWVVANADSQSISQSLYMPLNLSSVSVVWFFVPLEVVHYWQKLHRTFHARPVLLMREQKSLFSDTCILNVCFLCAQKLLSQLNQVSSSHPKERFELYHKLQALFDKWMFHLRCVLPNMCKTLLNS